MESEAKSATADDGAATATSGSPAGGRFKPKLLIAGGLSALLVVALGAAVFVFWPRTHDPAVAKLAKAAARQAAAASAAVLAASAAQRVASPGQGASASAAATPAATSTHPTDPVPTAAAPELVAPPLPATAAHPRASAMTATQDTASDEPIDRLRRRLGQVLSGKGELDAVATGDLRLRTRSAADAPLTAVKHSDTLHGGVGHAGALATPSPRPQPHATNDAAEHWTYEGRNGPQAWGRLKPEFATCASGQRQSPIDIRDGFGLDLEPLQFDYKASGFAVIDNGHTVQVNVAPGNSIEVLGRRFELQQFHFHRPSEERIDGRQFEMSVHLVHKDSQGRLAVVAVLLERGAAQPLLQAVWNNLPLEKGEEVPARAQLELNQLLPPQQRYFTYMGSLTTPPCSEGVLWMVMQQPVSVSAQQIDIFSRLYPMNARPIQQAAGRVIKQSN